MQPSTPSPLRTRRLDLIPATAAHLRAELSDRPAFARLLGARVPDVWPPSLYDRPAMKWTLKRQRAAPQHGWSTWYLLLRTDAAPVLAGIGGFKGPPEEGRVEIGYGVLDRFQRRGLATEATLGLMRWAFSHPRVELVIAHTLAELAPSIRVLEKCGFTQRGAPLEEGAIRFEVTREEFERALRG
jgi:RimJ/RimL family protein N-acetyltransferase